MRIQSGQSTEATPKTINTESMDEGVLLIDVDFFDNFADNYTVVISGDDYRDAGFFPVKVSPGVLADVSVMLVPKDPGLQFEPWDVLGANHPKIAQFLSLTPAAGNAKDNFVASVENHPKETACLLNLATAMSETFLANGTPLDYFRSIEWPTLAP